ncbi:Putative oxidoreductase, molybdopterin-binding domain, eukaryotic molybdopterin oxidoreductase [Septoria linicola]|uniref:Oxidoreductase, molybdopterin-binding domain, eukaryotic molybdopterin oxidoreductase n=1 Tax=Septoria linicola TaxID=215465 RepID=A0A9Q9B9M2_9PEZI|nr:putative oxidoreductase, molybdopterin-binding domain, eukaryotic molybdopterin oxidoreductase [Septoria linicola]USW58886.1 Putative oxidoreductase, molybdopterin-binding domain, eukaryotic molybdopterin oxidoreductase [Septoria linicola]
MISHATEGGTHLDKEDERNACTGMVHGFHIRHPSPAHTFIKFTTEEEELFQTIHLGKPIINHDLWRLRIHGLVDRPYILTLPELQALPSTDITSFHECYGSPLKAPTSNVWRIGNVTWTGVRLSELLMRAGAKSQAAYVWSDGLECGEFGGIAADRYQKDLPIEKAMRSEVVVAYKMNGQSLGLERGGPVRLVVPGWFGTNSTKWLCSLQPREERSPGPFTTTFYNELVPGEEASGRMRPVWEVEPNSMIVSPKDGDVVTCIGRIKIWGWAWSCHGISAVEVSGDGGDHWEVARLAERSQFEWQRFEIELQLANGNHVLMARARSKDDLQQPLVERRNHVHSVHVEVNPAP